MYQNETDDISTGMGPMTTCGPGCCSKRYSQLYMADFKIADLSYRRWNLDEFYQVCY
jgi:hypothetical protein